MSERYPDKTIIGLTGNIAVGKSLALGALAELGAAVIDADQVAHQVLLRGGAAYEAVLAAFGRGILGADGEIQRGALADVVFADPAQLRRLEAITHPAIRLEIDRRIRGAKADVLVIEAIKLLEGDLKNAVDAVWVVDASRENQLQRLTVERGMSPAEARRRIDGQNSQADKLRQADTIIVNDGSAADTRAQIERAWAALRDAG
ncbi:MAG: dephospho-CoA kinase [Anaerolineae bacterium]|nr:dephospho-CoA kinase [Anaerolineae bacterium]